MHYSTDAVPLAPAPYRRGLFVSALALTLSVFPLIWMGGLVTSHGVGLSVPDWPNSYGYNMFLFPPSRWLGGIFYEHTHRLLGTLSGFLAITLMLMAWGPARTSGGRFGWSISAGLLWLATMTGTIVAIAAARERWFSEQLTHALPHLAVGFGSLAAVATVGAFCRSREPREWVRWLTVGVFVAVCVQGTFGGLRVEQVNLTWAIIHGCFAQLFFCLAAFATLVTSRWWTTADPPLEGLNRRFALLAGTTTAVIFCQLIAGAVMRHNEAGLAIPGVLAYGHLLPPTDDAGLAAANQFRVWQAQPPLPPTTLPKIWMHFAHRMGAFVVTTFVLMTVFSVFQKVQTTRAARRAAGILVLLLATQVTLGVLTVYKRKPADVASLHVAVGALTLMTASVLTALLARQTRRQSATVTESAPAGRLVTV